MGGKSQQPLRLNARLAVICETIARLRASSPSDAPSSAKDATAEPQLSVTMSGAHTNGQ
jgi:hypothetical protein